MMTNAQLTTASLDDIVFDGRNRGYGAYELRALYQRHVTRALVIATAIFALILAFPLVAQLLREVVPVAPHTPIVVEPFNPDVNHIDPPIVPPPAAVKPPTMPPQPPTMQNVVPVVAKEEQVTNKDVVPNQEDLIDRQSGLHTTEGDPNANNTNLEELLPKGEETTTEVVKKIIYVSVEQMPELPGGGGASAIVAAIQRAVKYPAMALHNGVEGKVYASFTVNEKGEIVDLKIAKGLGSGLDEETLRAIRSLPKFIPGKQNGREVSVSFTVPVTYRIQ